MISRCAAEVRFSNPPATQVDEFEFHGSGDWGIRINQLTDGENYQLTLVGERFAEFDTGRPGPPAPAPPPAPVPPPPLPAKSSPGKVLTNSQLASRTLASGTPATSKQCW